MTDKFDGASLGVTEGSLRDVPFLDDDDPISDSLVTTVGGGVHVRTGGAPGGGVQTGISGEELAWLAKGLE